MIIINAIYWEPAYYQHSVLGELHILVLILYSQNSTR